MSDYDPKQIEPKWQEYWSNRKLFEAQTESKKPKYYALIEFPYPSGEGLHVGHPRPYIGMDVIARKRRMEGYNVLYPIGYDAFGQPAEVYAIKKGIHPASVVKENIVRFRKQIESLGISFDWSRTVNTTDPKYYKWTQWLFLKFLEHDLAYKAKMSINWCPKDKIGLANEEVVDGKCERCGTPVEKREKEQWMLAITKYAERLDKDLDFVDYPERVKAQQRNWIGRSEGVEIGFEIVFEEGKHKPGLIPVFTTRPDTIFGATYMVLAPDHLWITLALDENHKGVLSNADEVRKYVEEAKKRADIVRVAEGKEKTGVELKGVKAINPATKEEVPVFVADYVLSSYGTGAIMGVPADDARDKEFAEKYKLLIVEDYQKAGFEDFGQKVTKFKLRDWVFSRQRYWGEPIPVIHCEKCGTVPVPEKDLPVLLPEVAKYEPGPDGESPLATIDSWVNVECPKCAGKAKRETDTMPNWAGSSWYFLRYADPHNDQEFASKKALDLWTPVDWYNGGMEHTTLHLLYSRFWHKFFYDIKLVPTSEPYLKRTSHGFILAENGEKMSKSRGNVVNPDNIIDQFGTDTLRVYEMFMGPFEQDIAWSENSLLGPRRFIERVWKLKSKVDESLESNLERQILMNQTIQKVTNDIELMAFNTAISSLMVYSNSLDKVEKISKMEFENLILLLAPFAPHVCEELWKEMGNSDSIALSAWPVADPEKLQNNEITIAVQVNGKTRTTIKVSIDDSEEELKNQALNDLEVKKWLNGKEPERVIVILGKIVNVVL